MRTLFVLAVFSLAVAAQDFSQIKPLPPPGIPVSQQDQRILRAGLDRLGKRIEALKGNPHLADVEIFHKAVRFALDGNEFFREEQIFRAKELLRIGMERGDALLDELQTLTIPVVVVTGSADVQEAEWAGRADAVLGKPFAIDELLRCVRTLARAG